MTSQSECGSKVARTFGEPSHATTLPMFGMLFSQCTQSGTRIGGTSTTVTSGCSIKATAVAIAVLP